jgi:hypothetical protein
MTWCSANPGRPSETRSQSRMAVDQPTYRPKHVLVELPSQQDSLDLVVRGRVAPVPPTPGRPTCRNRRERRHRRTRFPLGIHHGAQLSADPIRATDASTDRRSFYAGRETLLAHRLGRLDIRSNRPNPRV